jgi:glycine/sarcosine/betaine reductase complex component A
MDPDNQALIKRIVEETGADGIVVMLGAADAEAVEVAAETVRDGDPAWVGPLAGVQLGLPVLHVFEDEVKEQADAGVYEDQIGFFEMTLDVDGVKEAMKRARGDAGRSARGHSVSDYPTEPLHGSRPRTLAKRPGRPHGRPIP